MKKIWIMMMAVALILSSCGIREADVSGAAGQVSESGNTATVTNTEGPTVAMSSVDPASTTAKSTPDATNKPKAGRLVDIRENLPADVEGVRYNLVPMEIWQGDVWSYVYVDREKLIEYLKDHEVFPEFSSMDKAEMMALPYYYSSASDFDQSGNAIVVLNGGNTMYLYSFLMNSKGENILKSDTKYIHIEPAGDYYLAFRGTYDAISCDVLTGDGEVRHSFENSGQGEYYDGVISFYGVDEEYDIETLQKTGGTSRSEGELAMFTNSYAKGGGYYAVADFSESDLDLGFTPDLMAEERFKKAIYKDGMLLTDYDYYYITRVAGSVFYVFDGEDYFFYDVNLQSRVMEHLTNRLRGEFTFVYRPGLIIAKSDGMDFPYTAVYITEDAVRTEYGVIQSMDPAVSYYYVSEVDLGSRTYYPQFLIKGNEQYEQRLNDFVKSAQKLRPNRIYPEIVDDGIIFTRQRLDNVFSVRGDLLVLGNIWEYSMMGEGTLVKESTFYHYNFKEDKLYQPEEIFVDVEAAFEAMLPVIVEKFYELYPDAPEVEDPRAFFHVDEWRSWFYVDGYGVSLVIPPGKVAPDFEGDVFFHVPKEIMREFIDPDFANSQLNG